MAFNFSLGIKEKPKTAKQTLFNVGLCALKACGTPECISFLGFNYNIANRLREEINKLTEQQAENALKEIQKQIDCI